MLHYMAMSLKDKDKDNDVQKYSISQLIKKVSIVDCFLLGCGIGRRFLSYFIGTQN